MYLYGVYAAEPDACSKMLQRLAKGRNNYTIGNPWG
jgi:hypothetical protein